ncbi:hypothetical protein FKW77_001818 [Venturia effusa]|uniref:Intradiol ring-cleavage dioxygenases domain-containing protein n=1 Tax=Venturia effusa TaxID=50376 RepID=A0A517LM94_9PEZI|nr:hypothetical protein FKW77_001818 [Venturia effusa]
MVAISKLSVAGLLSTIVAAHPGEKYNLNEVARQVKARDFMAAAAKRSLDSCSSSLKHRDLNARSVARRSAVAKDLREKRGISASPKKFRRDLATLQEYEAIDHNMTGIYAYTDVTDEATIFSANTSCILTPEVTDGPYYVTGESIRKNVKEDLYSEGVDLYLEVQYIDITTCEPVPDIYVDIWNANATGVYSGISVSGNYASGGYNSTYLRGIQPTDQDGVASFETIFPGHYADRAIHTHLLAHMNVSLNENGTLVSETGSVTHIGQLFWHDALREAVEATAPYNTNTQALTTNDEDMWSIVQAGTTYDPFPEFLYLGDDVTDGLLAWIQIGVNTTADYTNDSYYAVAAVLQADGGHASSSAMSFGGGNGTANGTMSGSPPNGTAAAPA